MQKYICRIRAYITGNLLTISILGGVSLLILAHSYFYGFFISWDSTHYLRAAQEILGGNGFFAHPEWSHFYGDGWFGVWPMGYPLLIAVVAFVTRAEVYLASVILSILVVWIMGLTFIKRFRRCAWAYALVMLNFGFLHILYFTWSEVPFLLGLVLFSFWTSDVITEDTVKVSQYIKLTLAGILLFLSRYIGAFAVGVIGLLWLYNLYLFCRHRDKTVKKRLVGLTVSGGTLSIFIVVYLLVNQRMTGYITGSPTRPATNLRWLVNNLYEAQLTEMNNVFHTFFRIESLGLALPLWFLFIGFVVYTVFKGGEALRRRDREILTPLVFLAMGGIYWCAIVSMRFLTLFDEFSYRLLLPATALLFIGFIGLLMRNQKLGATFGKVPQALAAGCMALFLLSALVPTITNPNPWGYREMRETTLVNHAHIPDGAVVVWGDPNLMFLRDNLAFSFDLSDRIPADLDVAGFFALHEGFSEIHVYIPRMRARIDNDLSGSPALLEFFEQYRYSDEVFVRLR
ncbi:MAG: hypothetical protein FWD99_04985 [Oscillospiraceae bacterium]|nr:hypothetical protein [Oscillospiraceae bacterium]